MSASQAMSRKKAAAGVTSKPTQQQNMPRFGEIEEETPKEISPNQLLVQHDYKLHVFENKIKELHERLTNVSRSLNNSDGGLSTVNENMLTEALQAMDARLDNLEEGLAEIGKSATAGVSKDLSLRMDRLEVDQSDLKALLLKIQGLAMETQMRMMQLRGNENTTSTSSLNNSPTFFTTKLETNNEEESGKKTKKNKN